MATTSDKNKYETLTDSTSVGRVTSRLNSRYSHITRFQCLTSVVTTMTVSVSVTVMGFGRI